MLPGHTTRGTLAPSSGSGRHAAAPGVALNKHLHQPWREEGGDIELDDHNWDPGRTAVYENRVWVPDKGYTPRYAPRGGAPGNPSP